MTTYTLPLPPPLLRPRLSAAVIACVTRAIQLRQAPPTTTRGEKALFFKQEQTLFNDLRHLQENEKSIAGIKGSLHKLLHSINKLEIPLHREI